MTSYRLRGGITEFVNFSGHGKIIAGTLYKSYAKIHSGELFFINCNY